MAIEPDARQLAEVAARARRADDGPVVMLNLNRYRDRAAYDGPVPGGLPADCSGHEAYLRYGAVAVQVIARVGGQIAWHATSDHTTIGEGTDRYDEVIAVWYPSYAAFQALITDPELLAAAAHRAAGLDRAAVIDCAAGAAPVLRFG